ncbi:hypothetical protein [Rhodopirellula sp. MGV]|uniref:hypothetical protein n=1 Tax=Rhodopirellula sp. MGV TaxID=2023130 RepID=UPI000B9642C5|nr:hypothetical protein [Rhodopirellula sp. MGV]OYP32331.1 hypothetical protein CGZ80_19890 [Rhodopirellula sp. MGV]PNY35886.1 hypothetical protein C2E31_15595 [Rhodopirellula baltica]
MIVHQLVGEELTGVEPASLGQNAFEDIEVFRFVKDVGCGDRSEAGLKQSRGCHPELPTWTPPESSLLPLNEPASGNVETIGRRGNSTRGRFGEPSDIVAQLSELIASSGVQNLVPLSNIRCAPDIVVVMKDKGGEG